MKNKGLLLSCILSLNTFSLISCSTTNVTKNTVNYRIGYDKTNLQCQIIIPSGFNYEELKINSIIHVKNDSFEGDCKVVRLSINQNENNYFLKGNKYIKKVCIESEYITLFNYDLFRNSSLEYIDLSKATGLKEIGDHVFAYSSLNEVKMPPNLEKLYKGVFMSTNVKEVIFSDTLKEIGINNFALTKNLDKVDFGNTLETIPASCFEKSSIKEVVAENVNTIDSYAFKNATNLESINFSNIKYVGEEAFLNTSIKEIELSNCSIKLNSFRGSKLEKLTLNGNCGSIEYGAFKDCSNLKTVEINGSLDSINSNAFASTKIESIELPDSLISIGSEAFKDCTSLKDVKLSSSLEIISSDAFRNCYSLSSIEFPSTIKWIFPGAFLNTSLKKVSLPKSVQMLENTFPSDCEINYY